MPAKYTTAQQVAAFWAKVNKSGPVPAHCPELGPCWVWTKATYPFGYGQIRINYVAVPAHRWAWEQEHGPVPAGLFTLHRCDNPPCVRPSHLFLGTKAQNSRDMAGKGRSTKGDRNPSRLYPERMARGERHPGAVLTAGDIPAIRSRYETGESTTALAVAFGVQSATIWAVVHNRTWRHVK